MLRKARIVEANTPVHITQRGNNRQDIFNSEEDKAFYIKTFMEYKKKFRVKVYAWTLMDNHVHFVLEPSTKSGLSKLFHALNTKYVMYYHSTYKTSGQLFGGRFFSCLLDEDHLYEAIRYVELNPYRAKLESIPGKYKWTSARERLGKSKTRYLNSIDDYFIVDNWQEYLNEPLEEENHIIQKQWQTIKKYTHRGIPAGSKDFLQEIMNKFKRHFSFKFRKTRAWAA